VASEPPGARRMLRRVAPCGAGWPPGAKRMQPATVFQLPKTADNGQGIVPVDTKKAPVPQGFRACGIVWGVHRSSSVFTAVPVQKPVQDSSRASQCEGGDLNPKRRPK
jgi:hypothetical protein